MSDALLRAEALCKSFSSAHRRLDVLMGIDLEVHAGEVVAVTGESGSGKSTLLNLLGSLDSPDSGRVLFSGRDLAGLRSAERSRFRNTDLGFVFQQHHLLGDFSALENTLMPSRIRGLDTGDEARARQLLESVGLGERLHHLPGELSGGEQQRVAVARALQNRPALLLLDEPGGNLDAARAASLHELLLGLARRENTAVLAVTHSRDLARRADRTLHLKDGRLFRGGSEGVSDEL